MAARSTIDLSGRRILVTGVATPDSIATAVARAAQEAGATVVVTALPRDLEAATAVVAELPEPPAAIIPVDATDTDDLARLTRELRDELGGLDAALHAIAFAPKAALNSFLDTPPEAAALAFTTSTWSYVALARVLADLAPESGGSLVGLDFDPSRAWPLYNWMGVAKSALQSANRYVARDLGSRNIRANLVAAGPLATRAATAIEGFDVLLETWRTQAPIEWDARDAAPVADAVCFLFSDAARAITGEVLHVDGGQHAIAAPIR
jgi:meromycolic acid enoyl-[acyl-carrier-protein] reductase